MDKLRKILLGLAVICAAAVFSLPLTAFADIQFTNLKPAVASSPGEAFAKPDKGISDGLVFSTATKAAKSIESKSYVFTLETDSYVTVDETHGLAGSSWKGCHGIYRDSDLKEQIISEYASGVENGRNQFVYYLKAGTYYLTVSNENAYTDISDQFGVISGTDTMYGPVTWGVTAFLYAIPIGDMASYNITGYDCSKLVEITFKEGYTGSTEGMYLQGNVFTDWSKFSGVKYRTSEDNKYLFEYSSPETFYFKITFKNEGWEKYPIPLTVEIGNVIPHDRVVYAKKLPTCSEGGYEEGAKCSICQTVFVGLAEIPATGNHTEVTDEAVAATVFKTGKTKGSHCSVCNKVIVAQKSTKKLTPTIKLSYTKKTVQNKKYVTLTVSKLAKGDSVKSIIVSKKNIVTIKKTATCKYKITGKKKGTVYVTVVLKSGKKAKCKVTVK